MLEPLGVALSAFNLTITLSDGKAYPLECVFQSAKVFPGDVQYTDLLHASPRDAKRYERLRTSGPVVGFRLEGIDFPTEPTTFFYDWLYVSTLHQHPELAERLCRYRAFTDIAFNPGKSLNFQARAAARYVGLQAADKLEEALASPAAFRKIAFLC